MATVTINPMLVTTAAGSFSIRSTGYVQGTAMDDPAVRYALTGGQLAATETFPMWGGCAIHDRIPTSTVPDLGGTLSRSNAVDGAANIAGFSVFNQAYAWISTPQSAVPVASALMTVPFYRMGSGARIAVKADPSMVSLQGNYTNTKVSWDFNDQMLVPFTNAYTSSRSPPRRGPVATSPSPQPARTASRSAPTSTPRGSRPPVTTATTGMPSPAPPARPWSRRRRPTPARRPRWACCSPAAASWSVTCSISWSATARRSSTTRSPGSRTGTATAPAR